MVSWEIIFAFGVGIYMSLLYQFLCKIEPFCFYLPGGLGHYYTVHQNIGVRLSDVIGYEEIKQDIKHNLQYFTNNHSFTGWLFRGPNGSGKTFMAKAIAGEAQIPFIEIYTDNMPGTNIPVVFNVVVKHHSPCIIFIDECGSTINPFVDIFLRKLDGMTKLQGVFLIVATSEDITKSLTRSGRIDKVINFSLPTLTQRKEVLKTFPLTDQEIVKLGEITYGFSYADMAIISREMKVMNKDGPLNLDELIYKIGIYKSSGISDIKYEITNQDKIRTAYHEVGHCLISLVLKGTNKPHRLTIRSEGDLFGNVQFKIVNDKYRTYSGYLKEIAVLLASSVFEQYYLAEYSSLCDHDFKHIRDLIIEMTNNTILENFFLMKEKPKFNQEKINQIMCSLIRFIINIIDNHKEIIGILVDELLEKETLHEVDIKRITGKLWDTEDINRDGSRC